MSRASNLDNIAPDDFVVEKKEITPKKSKTTKKIKKVKKTKVKENEIKCPSEEIIRQKIYQELGKSSPLHTSFSVAPKIFDFRERQEDENIFLTVRPHRITNLPWLCITALMILLPVIINFFDLLNFLPSKYIVVSTLFWYLLTFIYAFEKFLHWYFNVFIITDQRVVDIDFRNMLNKHFAEADLSAIQDVSSTVRGLLGTFFNFGTVLIQTAAETNQIAFENVPNPEKIIKILQHLREADQNGLKGGKK